MTDVRPAERPKRPRRKLQTPNPEVRERLMNATVELTRERGFPELRIEEIVEGAGLSVGTFYLYFDSKADLFVSIVTDYTERLRSRMEAAYNGEGGPLQRIARGLNVYLDFVEENAKGFLYFVGAAYSIQTSAGNLSRWAFDVHVTNLRPLLDEAMDQGVMRRLDVELTAQALVGVTQHMAAYWLENRDKYTRDQLRTFLTVATATTLSPV